MRAALQAVGEPLERLRPQRCSGQLEREGYTTAQAADAADHRRVLGPIADPHAVAGSRSYEQLGVGGLLGRVGPVGRVATERPERHCPLVSQSQPLTSRDEDGQLGAMAEEIRHGRAGGLRFVEVVEDQKQMAAGKKGGQLCDRARAAVAPPARGPFDRRQQRCCGEHAARLDIDDAVPEVVDHAARRGNGESGLPDATRTADRHETLPAQVLGDLCTLHVATDQRALGGGQVQVAGREGAGRRERTVPESGDGHRVQGERLIDALQQVLPERLDGRAARRPRSARASSSSR